MPKKEGFLANLKYDLPASIIVFLVAVPLCLGIALASGAPLFAGVIAGIIGGIVVGALSGSPVGVSGPAAGLAVIVLMAIQDLGTYEIFLSAVVVGGVVQLLLGFAKAGIIGYYFPSSVIKGMLSGIGIIIFLKQIPHAFGYDGDPEGDFAFAQVDGETTFSELGNMLNYISPGVVLVSAISIAILILWEQKFIKRIPIFQIVQGPLVVVVLGIVLNLVLVGQGDLAIAPEHLVSLPVADNLSEVVQLFTLPDFSQVLSGPVLITGVTIAVVASLETLLCVEATDKLDPYKRVTPTNRELKAQGVGNVISGLIGGLPITQVIVRSSANIQSGGRTKASAILHGFILLICVVSIPAVLNLIPLASLAAILLLVGYKLAKPAIFRQMWSMGHAQFVPFIVTIGGIVLTDLLMGIGLGLAVAVFYILYGNFKRPYFFHPEEFAPGEPIRMRLSEEVTFLNKASILQTLNHIPDNTKLIIDATKTAHIDPDVMEIFEDFRENASHRGITIEMVGMENTTGRKNSVKELQEHLLHVNANGRRPEPTGA
jgi:MFS superfamily sulfate permease-like transporter